MRPTLNILVILLLTLCLASRAAAQVGENVGCVVVDFELIDGQIPTDNMFISNQFFDEYGVTFSLEDGSDPVIAEVGPPVTAFSSAWGQDTPAPQSDIGRFFITDNGTLAGLEAIPLIVTFEVPLDSLSGCILDLDFSEIFTIDALGEDGEILESYIFRDGDPGTGDGIATCFGYNMDGCKGSIYGLRFSGTRTTPGGFGLGMDNFSFCFTGIDIINNLEIDVTEKSCESGEILLTNTGSDDYQYSLDDINYVSNNDFEIPQEGEYTIYVVNGDGCKATVDVEVPLVPPISIDEPQVTSTTCDKENGLLVVNTINSTAVSFQINDGQLQSSPSFENLAPGNYTMYVVDDKGCRDSADFTIDPSLDILIGDIGTIDDNCNLGNGSVSLNATGGNGTLLYGLGDDIPTSTSTFEELVAGEYTFTVTDGTACTVSTLVSLANTGDIIVSNVSATDIDCETQNAIVTISASGGISTLSYQLNGETSFSNIFPNVEAGMYQIIVSDQDGCEEIAPLNIGIPNCPIFLPNIISPTSNNAIQRRFLMKTNPNYDVEVLRYLIFDRWGNLVHRSGGWSIHNGDNYWWDGIFNGKPVESGVFAYRIDVRHSNGYEESLTGDLTVIW